MSNQNRTVVFVLSLSRADLADLQQSGRIAVTSFTHDQCALVFEALRAFEVLKANYCVGERTTLDALHQHWHIPTAPQPVWPLVHSGPDPVELEPATLDNDGDAIMLISAEKVEFHTRVALPVPAATE